MDSKKKEYNKYFKEYIDLVIEIFELSIRDGCECDTSPYLSFDESFRSINFCGWDRWFDKNVLKLSEKYLIKPAIVLAADRYAAQKSGLERQFSKDLTLPDNKTIDDIIAEQFEMRKKDFAILAKINKKKKLKQ